jgi:TonB family protein
MIRPTPHGRLACLAIALIAITSVRVAAQDVMVGEPASLRPMPAGDKLPSTFTKLHPDFPSELRALAEPGYVVAMRYVDADKKTVEQAIHGTHPQFQESVKYASGRWIFFQPAMRKRKRIPAHVWVPVIFNPKSAAEKKPDATPRLLAIAPVFVAPKPGESTEPYVVRVQLALDTAGAITGVTPAKPLEASIDQAVREALQKWRFAPARATGQPIAASLTMSVLCQPTPTEYFKRVPPKVISKSSLGYPPELNGSRMEAEVTMSYDVDAKGAVQNPVVVTSTNPAFDATALAALHEWKYAPATVDGEPVASEGLRTTFRYSTMGTAREAFEYHEASDQSKLRPDLRYDTPAKIRGAQAIVYPYALRRAGVTGTAKAVAVIDTRGRVSGVKIVSADKPEFGRALAAALEGFVFDPALKDGHPVPHLFTYEKKFDLDPVRFDSGAELLSLEKKHPERILSAAVLDAPLVPISRRSAVFPVTAPAGVESGSARIEVVIDEEGNVRLPRLVSASDEAFGYAAMQAASAWQFERPRKDGKPVAVRVQIPFSFTVKDSGTASEIAR